MKKYFVSNDINNRFEFVKKQKGSSKIAIYNQIPLGELKSSFNEVYKLSELYNDETFLKMLSKVNSKTLVFFVDLGLDYCSFKGDYIQSYTKLAPISHQAKCTFIVDGFAFYNTEKSIYRPFLYIDPNIIGSSVQEFYNEGIYKDFDGNRVENYYKTISNHIEINTPPVNVETINYTPTQDEINRYEALKQDIIFGKKFTKVKIIRTLLDFVNNSESKKKSLLPDENGILNVTKNDNRSRIEMYKSILLNVPRKVRFYSSNFYGADEIELTKTRDALIRHNKLIQLING